MAAAHEAVAPTSGHHRVREIEGLRAVAAGLVVVFHLSTAVNVTHPGLISLDAMYWMARLGPLGVAIFFVLSGFLLYQPFAQSALADEPGPALGRYYFRRFARIFPAYWLALAVWLFVVGPDQVPGVGQAAEYFGLVQNYHAGSFLRGLGVAWSLVIEVSFYLVLPLLAWLLRGWRVGGTRAARARRQFVGLACMYVLGITARAWAAHARSPFVFQHHLWRPYRYIDLWLPSYLDWFALGMIIAVVAATVQSGDVIPSLIEPLVRRPGVAWLCAFGVYCLLQQADYPTIVGTRYSMVQVLTRNTLMPVVALFVVAPVALGAAGSGAIRAVLRSRVLVGVGTVSYGIYLWHLIATYQVSIWITEGSLPRSALVEVLLVVALTAAAATLSYFFIERPFIGWSARIGRTSRRDSERAKVAAVLPS